MRHFSFLLILLSLTTLSSSLTFSTSTFDNEYLLSDASSDDLSDMQNLIQGYFSFYNMTPTDILQCFNQQQATLSFQLFNVFLQFINATASDPSQISSLNAQIAQLQNQLQVTEQCVISSSDYNKMRKVARFMSGSVLTIDESLYMFTNTEDWNNNIAPVVNLMQEQSYYSAGYNLANINVIAETKINDTGIGAAQFTVFQFAIFYTLGLSTPEDLLDCFTNETGTEMLNYFTGMCSNVYVASESGAEKETITYLGLIKLIPDVQQFYSCITGTSSISRLMTALGLGLPSSQLEQGFLKLVSADTESYYTAISNIVNGYETGSVYDYGYYFGTFLAEASKK